MSATSQHHAVPDHTAGLIRVRAARAQFVAAVGAAMVALVAAGIAPRWAHIGLVPAARWDAFDHLEGLLGAATRDFGSSPAEFRELVTSALPHLSPDVIRAAIVFADMLESVERL